MSNHLNSKRLFPTNIHKITTKFEKNGADNTCSYPSKPIKSNEINNELSKNLCFLDGAVFFDDPCKLRTVESPGNVPHV